MLSQPILPLRLSHYSFRVPLIIVLTSTMANACSFLTTTLEHRYKTGAALPWGLTCIRENGSTGLAGVVYEAITPLGFSAYGDQPQMVFGRPLYSYGIGAGTLNDEQRVDVFVSEPDRSVSVIDYRNPTESTYVREVLEAIDAHIAQRCGVLHVEWKQYHQRDIT